MRRLLTRTGWEPMKLAATASRAFFTAREFLCCWRRPRLAFNLDGGAGRRTRGISGRRLGTRGNGCDGFFLLAALAVSADYGAGTDAVKCVAVGFGAGHVSDVRTVGLD